MNEGAARQILAKLGCGRVTRSRTWLICGCPLAPYLHPKGTDSNPSFGVKVSPLGISGYNCKTCHRQGRLSGLVRAMEWFSGEQYPGLALEADLADAMSTPGEFEEIDFVDLPADPLSEAVYGNMYAMATEYPEAVDYLADRGITTETADFLDLRYDQFERRVMFVVRDTAKQLRGFTGRSIDPEVKPKIRDYSFEKRFWILGADRFDPRKPAFVVEGLFGWAHLFEIRADSICNPVALLGTEMTQAKAEQLITWGVPTFLCTDPDPAGETCLWGLPESDKPGAVDVLRPHIPVHVPAWPEGKIDPDQLTFEDVEDMLRCTEWSADNQGGALDNELD